MDIKLIVGIGYVIGIIGYIWLDKISKYNNKNFYNIKSEYKKFKSIRDEINQNNGWLKK